MTSRDLGALRLIKRPQTGQPARQFHGLLDGAPYTVAAKTDILKTFRRLGWVPPSEVTRDADSYK